jgi:septal ring factor EnvC (AmiA/AmiB activator)
MNANNNLVETNNNLVETNNNLVETNNNLVETNNNLVETNNELKELSQKELALQKEESQLRETLYRELLQITKEQNSLSFKLYDSGELTDEEMSTLVALRKRIREVKEFLNFSYKQS